MMKSNDDNVIRMLAVIQELFRDQPCVDAMAVLGNMMAHIAMYMSHEDTDEAKRIMRQVVDHASFGIDAFVAAGRTEMGQA